MRVRRCLPLRGKGAAEYGAPDHGFIAGESCCGAFALERWSGGAPGGRKHAVLRSMGPPCPRSHPAGGTAGSARTRSRVQTLENPFLGSGVHFPVSRPPKRRRRQAPARGLAVVYAHDRPKRNEAQRIRPLLVGRMRVYTAPKAPAAGTAGLGCRRRLGCGRRRGLDDDGHFLHAYDLPLAVALHQRDVIPSPLPGRHGGADLIAHAGDHRAGDGTATRSTTVQWRNCPTARPRGSQWSIHAQSR